MDTKTMDTTMDVNMGKDSMATEKGNFILEEYTLNEPKALQKKLNATSRDPMKITSKSKSNNLVYKFSTSTYQLIQEAIKQNYANENYVIIDTPSFDKSGKVVRESMKIYKKKWALQTISLLNKFVSHHIKYDGKW